MDDEERNQQEFDFNSSMTDLMTSLMVIFVLLLVILFNNIGEKGQKIRDKMVDDLTNQNPQTVINNSLKDLKITKSEEDPLSFIVNIDEQSGLKFESNKSDIMPQSKQKLKDMYIELLDYVCKPENKQKIACCLLIFTPCQITADNFSFIAFFCKDTIKAYGLCLRSPQLEVEFLYLKFSYSSSAS